MGPFGWFAALALGLYVAYVVVDGIRMFFKTLPRHQKSQNTPVVKISGKHVPAKPAGRN